MPDKLPNALNAIISSIEEEQKTLKEDDLKYLFNKYHLSLIHKFIEDCNELE